MRRTSTLLVAAILLAMTLPATTTAVAGTSQDAVAQIQVDEIGLEQFLQLVRADVQRQRTQVIGQAMALDAEQAAIFWPIYKEYAQEVALLDDQQNQNIKNYSDNFGHMTEAKATELANTALTIQQQRLTLRKLYFDRMAKELGAILAARFLQVDNQLSMLVNLQIASQLPLVTGQ